MYGRRYCRKYMEGGGEWKREGNGRGRGMGEGGEWKREGNGGGRGIRFNHFILVMDVTFESSISLNCYILLLEKHNIKYILLQ